MAEVKWLWRTCAGTELRESILRKYGRTYDLSIVRRQLAGRTIVAMNVMVLPAAAELPELAHEQPCHGRSAHMLLTPM